MQGRILVIVDLIVAAVVAALNLNSFLLQDAPQRRAALEEQTAHAIHQFPAQVAAVQSCCVGWFRRCHDHLSGTLRMPLPVLQQVFSMLMLQQLDLLTLPDKFDPTEKAQYLRDLEAIPVAQDTLKEVAALSTELRVLPREYALKRLEVCPAPVPSPSCPSGSVGANCWQLVATRCRPGSALAPDMYAYARIHTALICSVVMANGGQGSLCWCRWRLTGTAVPDGCGVQHKPSFVVERISLPQGSAPLGVGGRGGGGLSEG